MGRGRNWEGFREVLRTGQQERTTIRRLVNAELWGWDDTKARRVGPTTVAAC